MEASQSGHSSADESASECASEGHPSGDGSVVDEETTETNHLPEEWPIAADMSWVPQEEVLPMGFDSLRRVCAFWNSRTFAAAHLGAPVLAYNDDHVGFVFDSGLPDNVANDILERDKLGGALDPDGQNELVGFADGGQVRLNDYLFGHTCVSFVWRTFACTASAVPAFVSTRGAHSWRIWIGMKVALLDKTGFTLKATKEPSHWFYTMWPAWERYLERTQIAPGTRRSIEYLQGWTLGALFAIFGRLALRSALRRRLRR